ncbi:MAG: hypothetical protein ABIQ74_11830 [Chitinophagales bacterium]
MLSIFRSYHPALIFILLLYAMLFRTVLFIEPVIFNVPLSSNYLSQLTFRLLHFFIGNRSWVYHVLALMLVYAQALYFNHLINYYRLISKPSYIPAMSYLLLSSLLVEFTLLTAPLVANMFLLFALSKILSSYKKEKALRLIFDAGLMVAVASLFFFPYIVFILFTIASLTVLRPFNLREYLLATLGLLVPYYFIGVYFFWEQKLPEFWTTIKISHLNFPMQEIGHGLREISIGIMLLVVILWSVYFIQSNIFKMVVQVRSYMMIFILLFLAGAFSMLIQFNGEFHHFIWIVLPAGLAFSIFFTEFSRRLFSELLHLFLILTVLFFQYFHYVTNSI